MAAKSIPIKGDAIATFRNLAGLSQARLGELAGVDERTINRMEKGNKATGSLLAAVVACLDQNLDRKVKIEDFLGDTAFEFDSHELIVMQLSKTLPRYVSTLDRFTPDELQFVCELGYKHSITEFRCVLTYDADEMMDAVESLPKTVVGNFRKEFITIPSTDARGGMSFNPTSKSFRRRLPHHCFSELPIPFESVDLFDISLKRLRRREALEPFEPIGLEVLAHKQEIKEGVVGGLYSTCPLRLTEWGHEIAKAAYNKDIFRRGRYPGAFNFKNE